MFVLSDTFKALGDPIRLEMVYRLSRENGTTLGEISTGLHITRQGARKHLDVLERAGIIHLHKKGRITKVQLSPSSLIVVKKFIEKLELQWDQRLQTLKEFVEKPEVPPRVKRF